MMFQSRLLQMLSESLEAANLPPGRAPEVALHFKDRLAQVFTSFTLRPDKEAVACEIWKDLTGEDPSRAILFDPHETHLGV